MSLEVSEKAAKLEFGGESYEFDVIQGSESEVAINIGSLRGQSKAICIDPGFGNTGSCTSAITFLNGEKGVIHHRGYLLDELADNCSYLEVAYLLMLGRLPNAAELSQFESVIKSKHYIGPSLQDMMAHYPSHSHPMAVLASVVLSMTGFYPDMGAGEGYFGLNVEVMRLIAKGPSIAAHTYRHKRGLSFIPPKKDYGYAENLLHMMFGDELSDERRVIMAEALEKLLIIHADHEQNCSTSTVRVIASSNANIYAAISGGIGALWGPLHGGANEAVINMLETISMSDEDLESVINRAKDKSDPFRLMGFGHRVYKTYDPRAKIAKSVVDDLLAKLGVNEPLVDIAMHLEKVALEDEYFIKRNLYPNVDFYTGIAYKAMGIPKEMFTVLFAIGRMSGWLAHLLEFRNDPHGRISRPRQIYTGEAIRPFVPVSER